MLPGVPTPYRETPPERRAVHVEDDAPGDDAPPHALAVASAAGLAGATALLVGHAELSTLLGAGAVALGAHLWRAVRGPSRRDALEVFVGDRALEGRGVWMSPDGARRVRAVRHDPWPRWERLDPYTGETLASHRVPLSTAPTAATFDVIEQRAARVYGRPRRPRCFLSVPRELTPGPAVPAEPDWIVVVTHRRGVLLERRDREGRLLGDTLHDHLDDALRALAVEHPEGVGRWRAVPEGVSSGWRRTRASDRSWDHERVARVAL